VRRWSRWAAYLPGFFLSIDIAMARISFFIDGFNLYHAIADEPRFRRFRWIDLTKLAQCFIPPQDHLTEVFYFTAFASWSPDKVARHRLFIRAQELNGVKPVYGEFRKKTKKCALCHQVFPTFEEKETDVNIAIQLLEQALKDSYDTAMIISGDSDLLPALRAVKRNYPAKRFGIVIPPGRQAELLKKEADFYRKIKFKHLDSCRMPDSISLGGGNILECPANWR
jgi:uncharacterized LabA/DUF88 family protein